MTQPDCLRGPPLDPGLPAQYDDQGRSVLLTCFYLTETNPHFRSSPEDTEDRSFFIFYDNPTVYDFKISIQSDLVTGYRRWIVLQFIIETLLSYHYQPSSDHKQQQTNDNTACMTTH